MQPGTQVIVTLGGMLQEPEEFHCQIVDTPENRAPVPCSCGREGCKSFQTLGFVDRPGILRHVGMCRMRVLAEPGTSKRRKG